MCAEMFNHIPGLYPLDVSRILFKLSHIPGANLSQVEALLSLVLKALTGQHVGQE